MTMQFKKIGLMGKPNNPEVKSTFNTLINQLKNLKLELKVDSVCASLIDDLNIPNLNAKELASSSDLIIVVGGDGSLLNAARTVVPFNVPVVGVNRGRKGFLTDLSPQALSEELTPILEGQFLEESRFLLEASVIHAGKESTKSIALNDVVVYSGHVARMIELDVSINGLFVYRQRSDGLIITTPTGSTAYALSGGGPILHPSLEAIALVPMHPHTLSSRPIVVDSHSEITVTITQENALSPRLSWDGQVHADLHPGDIVQIKKHPKALRLLHPKNYDYYQTLRGKLGWHIVQ